MRNYLFGAALAIVALLSGCGQKTDEVVNDTALQGIKIRPSEVTLEEGESVKLHVKYVPEEAEATAPAVSWYSEKQRVASVDENGNVKADRVGTTVITAQCGKFEAKCTVEVTKLELPTPQPDPEINFSVSPELINAPAKGGTYDIIVKTDEGQKWTVRREKSWAQLSQTEGEGNATVQVTVDPADSESTLTQNITFKAGKGTYYVTIQRKGMQFSISPETIDVPSKGGTFTINVTSNIAWTASCEETWAKLDKTSGDGDATVSVTVDAANTESVTSQKIVFKAGGNSYYVTIKRSAKVKLAIDKTEINVPPTGGTYTVKVTAGDEEWSAKEQLVDGSVSGIVTITKSGNQATITVGKYVPINIFISDEGFVGQVKEIPITFFAGDQKTTLTLKVEKPYLLFDNIISNNGIKSMSGKIWEASASSYTGILTFNVSLKSNIPWELSVTYRSSNITDFVSLSTTSGTGNSSFTVTVDRTKNKGKEGIALIHAKPTGNWANLHEGSYNEHNKFEISFTY